MAEKESNGRKKIDQLSAVRYFARSEGISSRAETRHIINRGEDERTQG
jgi:hypothetical protein